MLPGYYKSLATLKSVKEVKFLVELEFINFGTSVVPNKVLVWEHKIFRIHQIM